MWRAVFVAVSMLAGCATTPLAINVGPFSAETPATALEKPLTGTAVRWGGVIISVLPTQTETCFEILSRPLDSEGEPRPVDSSDGRFVACTSQFHDPAAYPAGRHLTVRGALQAPLTCKIGDFQRRCPQVRIEALHLWPKQRYPRGPDYFDPYWEGRFIWPWYYR